MVHLNRAQIGHRTGIDTTVKSAVGIWRAFAPTWPMVLDYKDNKISDVEYTAMYKARLDALPDSFYDQVYEILSQHPDQVQYLLCYCRDYWFCHTHLLIEYLCGVWPDRFSDDRTYKPNIPSIFA